MDRNLRIRMLLEAGDKVSRPLRDIVSGTGKAAIALKGARDRLKELEKEQQKLAGFRKLKTELRDSRGELDKMRARATALGKAISKTEAPTRELTRAFRAAKRAVAEAELAFNSKASAINRMRDEAKKAGRPIGEIAREEVRLRREIAATNNEISEQGRRMVEIKDRVRRFHQASGAFHSAQDRAAKMALGGGAAIGAGVAATAPLRAFASDAIRFESAMADVRKTVDGMDDPKAFGAMSANIIDLSTRLPMLPEQIAAIVAAGGQIKIPREQLLLFAEDATKMGIAFEMTGDEAGQTMSKWRAAFGLGRNEVVKLADQVNQLGNSGASTLGVTDIVTRVGALGEVAGLNSGEIAAMAGTLSKVGVESEVAATGIKNTTLALTKGEAATKSQREALASLGLDAAQVAKNMQSSGSETIVDVMRRIGELRKDKQAGIMTDLFGSESVSAIAPMLTQLDTLVGFLRLTGDATSYAGSMNREYLSRANTTANALQLAENNLLALKITLGNDLLPMITAGAQQVGSLARSFRSFAQENPAVASWLLKIAAGFGIAMVAGGSFLLIGAGLTATMAPFHFAAKMMGTTLPAASLKMGKGLLTSIRLLPTLARVAVGSIPTIARLAAGFVMANPFLALAMGIGVAIFLVVKHWDTVKELFRKAKAWLMSLDLKSVGSFIMQGLVSGIKGAFSDLTAVLGSAAKIASSVFPKKMEIRSPSRLYHRYGGFMMEGLSRGIQAGADAPVRDIDAVAQRMSNDVVVGSVLAGFRPSDARPLGKGTGIAGSAAQSTPVNIQIYGSPGQSEQQLAALVGEEIRRVLAGNTAGRASSYADRADYGDA